MLKGSCLCGGVTFTVSGPVPGPSVCHCSQCRKQSGHVWASAHVPDVALTITGDSLRWHQSSDLAKRGFCGTCGSFLFWRKAGEGHTSFAMGAIDGTSGVRLAKHIFTADKGDYYAIDDDLPQS